MSLMHDLSIMHVYACMTSMVCVGQRAVLFGHRGQTAVLLQYSQEQVLIKYL